MKISDIKNAVIVPWDYSEMSMDTLQKAIDMVDPSLIHVVHVSEYPTAYEYGVAWEMVTEETRTENLQTAFQNATDCDARLQGIRFKVLFGNPGKEIGKYATAHSANLILMASHSRTGIARLMLGSVAERILRSAPCPALILRETTEKGSTESLTGLASTKV